jgi:hypothetical protein
MSEYILILVVSAYGGTTSQAILFPTQQACETAKVASSKAFYRTQAVCVPRNVP